MDIIKGLDRESNLTLYDYIFLRRVNKGMNKCGENGYLQPHKIYCALSITSPQTRFLTSPDEKQLYISAIILKEGFYYG